MLWDPSNRAKWLRYSAAVLVVFAAAAIRLQFLEVLGFRVTFITFYPAVAVAALFGGFGPGFLSTVLSVAIANYFWMEPVGGFGITNIADLTSIIVFLFSCTLIGFLAEATYRSQARAHRAEEQSRLAAEREKGAVDLQRSESRYRELVQNANSAIIRWKSDGSITFFNEYAQELFGYSGDEIIGKHVGILVPRQESTGTDLTELVQDIVNFPDKYSKNVNENILRDGRRVWMVWSNRPILDRDGHVVEILAVGSDITERIEAEQALHESEDRFRLLSRTAGRLLASDDPQGIVNELCRDVMEYLDCQVFFNFLADEGAGRLRLNACAGISEEEVKRIEWLDYGVAVCGTMAREERRIVAGDIQRFPDPRTDLVKSYGIQACACHPLVAQGRLIGTLSFGTKTRGHFQPDELGLMKTVADQVATAMERKRLVADLQRARDDLEMRVSRRTAELAEANQSLKAEIAVRLSAEKTLVEKHEQLHQSEELLRNVLDTLPVGVWITDQDGKISMANPAAERIWGGRRYVGLDQYGEYKGWWADTGELIAPEEWALARAITRGEVSINEIIDIQCFDGTRKTILNSASPIRDDRNEIVRAIVVNQDITELRKAEGELKRSEERLRKNVELLQLVFDGISDPLIMFDGEGLVRMINRAAMDYYGVVESMDVFGKPCFQGLRGRETACPECHYPFPTADGASVTFERKGLKDKGKVESVTIYPVPGESGGRDALIVKISDVTRAKILERQILQNEKLVSLGLVTSGIAHEINNPNSFIYFNIPILKRYLLELLPILDDYAMLHPGFEVLHMSYGELREDIFRLLENMEHGSQRINKIVGVLKSFARKRDPGGMQKVDLKHLIDKVVALCHAEMRRRIKSFEALIPDNLPPLVSDPEALEQVLLNLLINAIHAADKEDSKVTLRVVHGGSDFVIEVIDNGSGMDETVRKRIFDPFFTTKPSTLGTGLGLYICHSHVESLGGRIEVESTVGEGSAFRIVLPRADEK